MPATRTRPSTTTQGPAGRTGRIAISVAVAACLALGGAAGADAATVAEGSQSFLSRPDLQPTAITFTKKETKSGMGYVFTAPKSSIGTNLALSGPMIVDGNGNLVWFKPVKGGAYNFRKQTYEGKPVLTYWHGTLGRGFGFGVDEIYDANYHHVATVKAGNGYKADLHEFTITPQNTALIVAYRDINHYNLKGKVEGGTTDDKITDNVLQEIDIKTGKVLLEWHTKDAIAPNESYSPNPNRYKIPYDYAHLNSAEIDTDGNILVSARGTHAYYRINRKTGKLMERIGGKKSDYKMGPGARTAFQHDVQRINDKQITAFDNNADTPTLPISEHQTRGVVLNIDEKKKTVTLARQIFHPGTIFQSVSQGNMQTLANGDVFFGWGGNSIYFTEVDKRGKTVLEGQYETPRVDSYRAYRETWTGTPTDSPAAVASKAGAQTKVSVSWNGATQVQSWRILAGPSSSQLAAVVTVPHKGFETTSTISSAQPTVQVQGLDAAGKVLGTSPVVTVTGR